MAYDFNATADLTAVGSPFTAHPATLACWYYPDTITTGRCPISIGLAGGTGNLFSIEVQANTGFVIARLIGASGAQNRTVTTTTGVTTNAWSHVGGVFASLTSRTAYINGIGTTATDSGAEPANLNRICIGARFNGSAGLNADGKIAEAAMWNVALTQEEMAALAKGFSPSLIRPDNLVVHVPLVRNITEMRDGYSFAANTTITVFEHPRRIG